MKTAYLVAFQETLRNARPYFSKDDPDWPKDGRTDYYGFEITKVSEDGAKIDLTWSFKDGERYCCVEPGCHTNAGSLNVSERGLVSVKKWWARLRSHLSNDPPSPIIVNVPRVVEKGCWVDTVGPSGSGKARYPVGESYSCQYQWEER